MHVRRLLTAALMAAALPWTPAHATPSPKRPLTSADLPRLTAELTRVTQHAQQLSAALDQAAAQDGGLRVAYARLDDARYAAQEALDVSARRAYMAHDQGFSSWQYDLAAPSAEVLARRAAQAGFTVDQALVDAVTAQKAAVDALQRQADGYRTRLMAQAREVLAEEETARELYLQAKAIADAEQLAAEQAQLEAQRQQLDDLSTDVTLALTPAQTARARRALEQQAPIVALLERSGGAIPAGYQSTGMTVSGTASWYGPGFVGRPTASGAPYDPERLTCANKELPLGTVIHVTANGYAVNCLVNDRGPYVGDRILDMSRAGSRALGYSGLADVTIDVLTPV